MSRFNGIILSMNGSNKFETFLPQAPPRNMSAVSRDVITSGTELLGGTGKPLSRHLVETAEEQLAKFREEYQAAKEVPIENIAELKVESREELIIKAAALFAHHATPRVSDKETMVHASLAGCAVVMAFIELTARLHSEMGLGVSNDEDYRRVMTKSQVTLLKMAGSSRDADGTFMTNACTWTRGEIERLSDEKINAELHFDESYFELTEAGVVSIKIDKETRRRAGKQRGNDFDFSPNKNDILFGCPHRSGIARLHGAILEASLRNNLLQAADKPGSFQAE